MGAQTSTQIGILMKDATIEEVVRSIICRTITPEKHYGPIAKVAKDHSTKSIKEALLYLEYANWNVGEALLQRELDAIDGTGPVKDKNGSEIDNRAANKQVDRRLAKPGSDYDYALTKFVIVVNGQKRTFTYPDSEIIEPDDQEDINDLNRWRHDIFRKYIGPEKKARHNGPDFHEFEQTYILNRYATLDIDYRGQYGIKGLLQEHKTMFEGINLPGRATACGERTVNSIGSLISRRACNPTNLRGKRPASLSTVRKHELAQARIKAEWRARFRANDRKAGLLVEDDDDEEDNTEEYVKKEDSQESSSSDESTGDEEPDSEDEE